MELAPTDGGWVVAERLTRDRVELGAALERTAARIGSERADVCAQQLLELWVWNLVAAPAAMLVAERRLPELAPEHVLIAADGDELRMGLAGGAHALAGDPLADEPDVTTAANEDELLERLVEMLADRHLEPLVETLNEISGRPRSALWRGAGDRLVGALLWAGERLQRPARALELATGALAVEGPLSGPVRVVEVDVGDRVEPLQVRNGCCIWHRVPGEAACLTCPLVGAQERRSRTIEWLAER